MPTIIKTKKTFGTTEVIKLSPEPTNDAPISLNMVITFEEALKLNLSLGQALAKLNSYNRSTVDGKRTAINLCLHRLTSRITVNETKLAKSK